jgi:hypothetical protein
MMPNVILEWTRRLLRRGCPLPVDLETELLAHGVDASELNEEHEEEQEYAD